MNKNFIVTKYKNKGKGTLFSSFRSNIPFLLDERNQRRNNIVINMLKTIHKAYEESDIKCDESLFEFFEDIDNLYMHTYVICGGYASAILALSDYLLDGNKSGECDLYGYEGSDGLLFPLLFVCSHGIEIAMKSFIFAHGIHYNKSHNISELLEDCKNVCLSEKVKENLNEYTIFIKELDRLTCHGFATRYALDILNDENYLKSVNVIDVEQLRDLTCDVIHILTRFSYGHWKYF